MKNPLFCASFLALALVLAGAAGASAQPAPATAAATTADGKTILPSDFIGPPAPNQCIAGSSGCAAADPAGASASDPATEQALADVGRQQMMDSVKKDEDGMLKSGVYKSIDRTADGAGAIITMPDGSVMWSDYKQGFDTMPQKDPQALLAMLQKNGNTDPATLKSLKDAIAKLEQKSGGNNAGDQAQLAAANGKMFGGARFSALSLDPGASQPGGPAPAPAAAPSAPTPSDSGDPAAAPAGGAADPNAYAYNQGNLLGQTGLFGSSLGGGAMGQVGEGAPDAPLTAAAPAVNPAGRSLNPDEYEFTGVRKAAARAQAVLGPTLDAQHGADAAAGSEAGDDLRPDSSRGFNSSVNR